MLRLDPGDNKTTYPLQNLQRRNNLGLLVKPVNYPLRGAKVAPQLTPGSPRDFYVGNHVDDFSRVNQLRGNLFNLSGNCAVLLSRR